MSGSNIAAIFTIKGANNCVSAPHVSTSKVLGLSSNYFWFIINMGGLNRRTIMYWTLSYNVSEIVKLLHTNSFSEPLSVGYILYDIIIGTHQFETISCFGIMNCQLHWKFYFSVK